MVQVTILQNGTAGDINNHNLHHENHHINALPQANGTTHTKYADTHDDEHLANIDFNEAEATTGCSRCRESCHRCCLPCIAKHHTRLKQDGGCNRIQYCFLCPPHGYIGRVITLALIAILIWAVAWSMLGADVLPGGNLFGIVILFIVSSIGGFIAEYCKLPPLLGMLIAGLLIGNVPVVNYGRDILPSWSSGLRKIALVVILIRAGLGLNLDALRRLKWVIIRLALLPLALEATTIAVCMVFFFEFPWSWGFMQGFVISAVSAAVAIPFMLLFQQQGYGTKKGVPTLLMAAASIDNVTAISCFSIVLGITFTTGDLAFTIVKGPLQLVIGLVLGFVLGLVLWYLPHVKNDNKLLFRFVILFGVCLLGVFGSGLADFSAAGPLGVLICATVAAYKWRQQGWNGRDNPMPPIFSYLWRIFEILLFGLVGALVDVTNLNWNHVGLGAGVIGIGLAARLLMAFLMLLGSILNYKERMFAVFTWLPKATVQAAIGSMALDRAIDTDAGPEAIRYGTIVLTTAVISILITSPIGAAAVAISGPRCLEKESSDQDIAIKENNNGVHGTGTPHPQQAENGHYNSAFVVSDGDPVTTWTVDNPDHATTANKITHL